MRWEVLPVLLVMAGLLFPLASAHGPADDPISVADSVLLEAAGSAASVHTLFLPLLGHIEAGDRASYDWRADEGDGPDIVFEIVGLHDAGEEVLRQVAASAARGDWTVPGDAEYALRWTNPNPEPVTLSYDVEIRHPPPPFDYIPVILLSVTGGLFVYLLWRGRRQRAPPPEGEA